MSCVTDTTDTVQVVKHIRERFPSAVVGGCGISLGALVLGRYLVEHSDSQEISVAMLNCTPFNVLVASDRAESGPEIFFNMVITGRLLNLVRRFRHTFETSANRTCDLAKVMESKTIREYDDRFIGKMYGYQSAIEYYRDASLSDKMHKMKIPVLCFNAADDIFQPLKYSEHCTWPLFDNSSDQVVYVVTPVGGHIAHLEGWIPFWKKKTYQLRVFNQFFSVMFEDHAFKRFLPSAPAE